MNVIACSLVGELRDHGLSPVPGSVEGACRICRATVIIAPSSLRLLDAEPEALVACMACAGDLAAAAESVEFRAAPGALAELQGRLNPAEIDEVRRIVGDLT